jgi:hypothetical protein
MKLSKNGIGAPNATTTIPATVAAKSELGLSYPPR